jgi:signal transduction histidine kinase/CheY-like chemotaxis protein
MRLFEGYSRILRSRLFARYALLLALTICGLLAIMGAFQIYEAWAQNVSRARVLLAGQAGAAASRIEEHLAGIERQVQAVATLPWATANLNPRERAFEYARLQRVIPSITELRAIDEERRERVHVSRLGPNSVGSGTPVESEIPRSGPIVPTYGEALFRGGVDPHVWIAFREDRGETAALVNMKFISDYVAQMRFGQTGQAFVVDRSGYVIAHPDLRIVLQRINVSSHPHIAAMFTAPDGDRLAGGAAFDGTTAEFAAEPIGRTGWWTVVQQSRDEMLAPVRQAAYRLVALTVIGLLWAGLLALWLARHLSSPILELRQAAARIGEGDLKARAEVSSTDELKGLADEFNGMAGKLEESYATLEKRVESRTRELADANAAKTRFLATASHDLRQPMHAIGLLVGVLNEQAKDRNTRALIAKVQGSVDMMDRLFASLLDISKLDAGAIEPSVGLIELRSLLQGVEANYGALAAAKGLRLRIVQTNLVVRSDPLLLERIVGNLVSNAIRYTQRGGIVVGCRRRGDRVELQVVDSGRGIPPRHLGDVFAEFFQVPGPERIVGLGLGLSIVKRSAELLKHDLRLASTLGKGSVFSIELPVAPRDMSRRNALPASIAKALAGHFVIAIDDDPVNRLATEALFAQWGCVALSGASSGEILMSLEGRLRGPDLIVTDLRLGEGDSGLVAIDRIRAAVGAHVPAMLLTGDVTITEEARAAAEAGVVVLHKPVSAQELRRVAASLLSHDDESGDLETGT